MCGIAGIVREREDTAPIARDRLDAMVRALRHRGPDGYGFFTSPEVGLAHARLSIIDLEGGAQPIGNEDGSIQVVLNGEIFNYLELRRELLAHGHRFSTASDTEVLVHLYEQYGDAFIQHLNGQFAFALWDGRSRRLLLVRDRVGIAPLFYCRDRGSLLFASEIKALLAGGMAASPNLAALDQIMTFWAPVGSQTAFAGIQEVQPGEMLVISDGRVRTSTYWRWDYPENDEYRPGSDAQLAEALKELLVDATRLRLRADVPVGAYLSGGLDSSAIAAVVAGYSDARLRTFSIGFDDPAFDERRFQSSMIRRLGTHHTAMQVGADDIADSFPEVIRHTETPILRTAPAPMRLLSRRVRQEGFKVVLTGEGADEVFGGYDIFKEAKIRRFWSRRPDSRFRATLLKRLYPYLNITGSQSLHYLKEFFGRGLENPESPYFSHLPRWTTTAGCKTFFSSELAAHLRDNFSAVDATLPAAFGNWHHFNRAQYLEARGLMNRYLLCSQGDRMLMANSVEGRFPFLDHRLIEFGNSLHPNFKMRALNEKYLLRLAMAAELPSDISGRHKQPYRAPDAASFFAHGRCTEYVAEMLSPKALRDTGYFAPDKVEHLLKKLSRGGQTGYRDNMAFVGILSTQIWHRTFIKETGGSQGVCRPCPPTKEGAFHDGRKTGTPLHS